MDYIECINTYQLHLKDQEDKENWLDLLNREEENEAQNGDENMLKIFNHLILQDYDMEQEEYNIQKIREIHKEQKVQNLIHELSNECLSFFLVNANTTALTYYKPNNRNKLELFKNRKLQGYEVITTIKDEKYDQEYYKKQIDETFKIHSIQRKGIQKVKNFLKIKIKNLKQNLQQEQQPQKVPLINTKDDYIFTKVLIDQKHSTVQQEEKLITLRIKIELNTEIGDQQIYYFNLFSLEELSKNKTFIKHQNNQLKILQQYVKEFYQTDNKINLLNSKLRKFQIDFIEIEFKDLQMISQQNSNINCFIIELLNLINKQQITYEQIRQLTEQFITRMQDQERYKKYSQKLISFLHRQNNLYFNLSLRCFNSKDEQLLEIYNRILTDKSMYKLIKIGDITFTKSQVDIFINQKMKDQQYSTTKEIFNKILNN